MSSLIKLVRVTAPWLKKNPSSLISVRHHWNKDFKPLPYPKTFEEKAASAERYGIPLAEYEPYPDDGSGCGDYPKLPLEAVEHRDPYYPWDNPELKKNYNEVLHDEYDFIREDRYNVNYKLHLPLSILVLQYVSVMGGAYFLYWIFEYVKAFHPVMPPQLPKENKVYYTFEKP
ncbi:NADH:ubiquinone oxidoreductase subunit ASHI [Rhynchophorus ferrugineus]|uniref:Uncharacterized protein n=1 Tax=Rhynchophorus ferrugineus TaxID=354439 RepID=A0A834INR5_RHYFE|nr:hypothetical protein GWI33_022324 [Rhynchophorus ferrugineus]